MRDLIWTGFITADGVIDSPGGGDHPHAGWVFKDVEFDEAAYEIKGREMEEASALLFGRRTYDEFAPVWPDMEEFATYNAMPKYVVSSTLSNPEWNDTTVLRSLDDVAKLKQDDGDDGGPIFVHASAELHQGLLEAGLIDRYYLLEFPLILGTGKRLFAEGTKHRLKLTEHAAYDNGVQLKVYDVVHDS